MSRDVSLKVVSVYIIASLFSVAECQTKFLHNGLIEDERHKTAKLSFKLGDGGKNEVQLSDVKNKLITPTADYNHGINRTNSSDAGGINIHAASTSNRTTQSSNKFLSTPVLLHKTKPTSAAYLPDSLYTKFTRNSTHSEEKSATFTTTKQNWSTILISVLPQKQTTAWGRPVKITGKSVDLNEEITRQNGDTGQSVPTTMQLKAQITSWDIHQTALDKSSSEVNPSESHSTLLPVTKDNLSVQSKWRSLLNATGARHIVSPVSINASSMPSTQNHSLSLLEHHSSASLSVGQQSVEKTDILPILPTLESRVHVSDEIELQSSTALLMSPKESSIKFVQNTNTELSSDTSLSSGSSTPLKMTTHSVFLNRNTTTRNRNTNSTMFAANSERGARISSVLSFTKTINKSEITNQHQGSMLMNNTTHPEQKTHVSTMSSLNDDIKSSSDISTSLPTNTASTKHFQQATTITVSHLNSDILSISSVTTGHVTEYPDLSDKNETIKVVIPETTSRMFSSDANTEIPANSIDAVQQITNTSVPSFSSSINRTSVLKPTTVLKSDVSTQMSESMNTINSLLTTLKEPNIRPEPFSVYTPPSLTTTNESQKKLTDEQEPFTEPSVKPETMIHDATTAPADKGTYKTRKPAISTAVLHLTSDQESNVEPEPSMEPTKHLVTNTTSSMRTVSKPVAVVDPEVEPEPFPEPTQQSTTTKHIPSVVSTVSEPESELPHQSDEKHDSSEETVTSKPETKPESGPAYQTVEKDNSSIGKITSEPEPESEPVDRDNSSGGKVTSEPEIEPEPETETETEPEPESNVEPESEYGNPEPDTNNEPEIEPEPEMPSHAEPVPEWDTAINEVWGPAWEIHVYGIGILFALLALYSLVSMIRLRSRRLLSQGYFIALNFIMLVMGIDRAVYLLVDPYNSRQLFPAPLAYFLHSLAFPCLTSAFSILFLALLQSTKMQLVSPKIQKVKILTSIICVHFALSVSADLIVGFTSQAKILLLVCQAAFVLWGLLISCSYIYIFKRLYSSTVHRLREMRKMSLQKAVYALPGIRPIRKKPRTSLGTAVKVTLVTASFGLLCCGLQLYGMVDVYGLHARHEAPQPWPWWIFQFTFRLCELGMCVTMSYVATQPFRYTRKGERKHSSINFSWCTKCCCYNQHNISGLDVNKYQYSSSGEDELQIIPEFDANPYLHNPYHELRECPTTADGKNKTVKYKTTDFSSGLNGKTMSTSPQSNSLPSPSGGDSSLDFSPGVLSTFSLGGSIDNALADRGLQFSRAVSIHNVDKSLGNSFSDSQNGNAKSLSQQNVGVESKQNNISVSMMELGMSSTNSSKQSLPQRLKESFSKLGNSNSSIGVRRQYSQVSINSIDSPVYTSKVTNIQRSQSMHTQPNIPDKELYYLGKRDLHPTLGITEQIEQLLESGSESDQQQNADYCSTETELLNSSRDSEIDRTSEVSKTESEVHANLAELEHEFSDTSITIEL
ncbi:uncharacterized protein LOC100375776 [Saccoglossus kowalevskii]|uniref:Uncharacterized protein LOC100375776 n=1 Tax=Saccoglossus kowalevskii TaxID=10224 RepID=A0ABM0GUV2_SACKO|nr:PREDICTED: uncharacterized protein LOC100375776 [Saccoglossus kowalevskii]